MQVDIVRQKNLKAFVEGDLFKNLSVIPISTLRARYFLANAKACSDDVIIVLVREEYETLGFAVFLPDNLKDGGRFAWNSGWWVHPYKGRKIALLPLIQGIELWNERVAFADLPAHSSEILTRLNRFTFGASDKGIKIVISPYLPRSMAKHPVLKFADQLIRFFPVFRFGIAKSKFNWKRIDLNANGLDEYIKSVPNKGLTQRTIEDFMKIFQFPWLASISSDFQSEQCRFPFSLVCNNSDLGFYALENQGVIVSFAIFKQRDAHFSIPYLFCNDDVKVDAMAAAMRFAINKRCKTVTVFRQDLVSLITKVAPLTSIKKEIFSRSAYGKNLLSEFAAKGIVLQDGEGDCIFS
jgi:hypothetical protein